MERPEHVWVVRLALKADMPAVCLERGAVGIGATEMSDLSAHASLEEMRTAYRRACPDKTLGQLSQAMRTLWTFSHRIGARDWVVSPLGGEELAVGAVSSAYAYDPKAIGEYAPHVVRVSWFGRRVQRSDLSQAAQQTLKSAGHTVFSFDRYAEEVARLVGPDDNGRVDVDEAVDIARVAAEAHWHRSEAATVSTVIRPMLEALGWDKFEGIWEQHQVEGASHVDLALVISEQPVVFVEAKPFGAKLLPDGSEVKQALDYAYKRGVNWAVLTTGGQWWVYDAFAKVPHPRKRILAVDVLSSEADGDKVSGLALLSPDAVSSGKLRAFAERAHWYAAVRSLLEDAPDDLVKMVARHGKLEVNEAVAREALAAFARSCPRPSLDE